MPKASLTEVKYVYNQVLRGMLGNYYFVPKAKMHPNGMLEVVGKKHDVTESIQALLSAQKKPEKKAKSR